MLANNANATILIVDDTPTNLEVLYDALDSADYKVLIEMDAWQAIEIIKSHKPDLILLDVMMPGMNGFEICCQLQANPTTKDIPIIFMTALSDTADKVQGLSLGAVDYITKPFQQAEVLARIKLHLKLRQLNLELTQQKEQLEERVCERTTQLQKALAEIKEAHTDLQETLAELQKAHIELQQTQLHLVQNEKMSSIGQLVAGVAHEINNPVGFIAGNLQPFQEYVQDLFSLIDLYQRHYPDPVPAIQKEIEATDLQYMRDDLPRLLASMKEGSDRIRDISISLRTFSRADNDRKVPFNIHEGIDSTILILKHRLKALEQRPDINIVRQYNEVPLLECFPGQLNQVFMNILANAIDALEESFVICHLSANCIAQRTPTIKIRTQVLDGDQVMILIADNGSGMSAEVQEKVFDHLFTTKSVGKGTGLGLSIAKQIVEDKHGGKLSFVSELGRGTEFAIEIPIQPTMLT